MENITALSRDFAGARGRLTDIKVTFLLLLLLKFVISGNDSGLFAHMTPKWVERNMNSWYDPGKTNNNNVK